MSCPESNINSKNSLTNITPNSCLRIFSCSWAKNLGWYSDFPSNSDFKTLIDICILHKGQHLLCQRIVRTCKQMATAEDFCLPFLAESTWGRVHTSPTASYTAERLTPHPFNKAQTNKLVHPFAGNRFLDSSLLFRFLFVLFFLTSWSGSASPSSAAPSFLSVSPSLCTSTFACATCSVALAPSCICANSHGRWHEVLTDSKPF